MAYLYINCLLICHKTCWYSPKTFLSWEYYELHGSPWKLPYSSVLLTAGPGHKTLWGKRIYTELCLCLGHVCPSCKLKHRCVVTPWRTMNQKDRKEPSALVWPTLTITQETWMLSLLLARLCLFTVSVYKLTLILINKFEIYWLMPFIPTLIMISWWCTYAS